MSLQGWAEIALTIALAVGLGWPLGIYMSRIWQGQTTWLDPVLRPVERGFYRLSGVDPDEEQGWFAYALSFLAFSAAAFVFLFAILRLQGHLPLNPGAFVGMAPDLAFNTAISFVTNTDWSRGAGRPSN